MRCPKCGGRSEVVQTIQRPGSTERRRLCLAVSCRHAFRTRESAQAMDLPEPALGQIEAALRDVQPTGRFDNEALAAALRVDARRREIQRAERDQDRRLREAARDAGLNERRWWMTRAELRDELGLADGID